MCLGVKFNFFFLKLANFLFELLFGWAAGGDGGSGWLLVGGEEGRVIGGIGD